VDLPRASVVDGTAWTAMAALAFLGAATLTHAGCDLFSGRAPCAANADCPTGLVCGDDGFCIERRPLPADAGPTDAGPEPDDAGPDQDAGPPPVASPQRALAYPGSTLEIVLAGDAGDADPGALSFLVDPTSARGVELTHEGGRVEYAAPPNLFGQDSFGFRVSLDGQQSERALVTIDLVGQSCGLVRLVGGPAPNGTFFLDPDGEGGEPPWEAFCDLGFGGALAMKIDGLEDTFVYESELWTNDTLLNERSLALTRDEEAKLEAFLRAPVDVIQVSFFVPRLGTTGRSLELLLPGRAPSLRALFAGGFTPAFAGRARWQQVVPGAPLQPHCDREGVNAGDDRGLGQARIGLLANDQEDCVSPDTTIGVGLRPQARCDVVPDPPTSAGSWSTCIAAPVQVPAFALVAVRDTDFTALPPAASCAAHLALDRPLTGVYRLDPDGEGGAAPFPAFCDMTLDGGGWTLVGRSVSGASPGTPFGWTRATGSVDDDTAPYSLGVLNRGVPFREGAIGSTVVGKAWGEQVYAVTYPDGFASDCLESACQVVADRPRHLLGDCRSTFGPTMLRRQGYLSTFPWFFTRDITAANDLTSVTGLQPYGFFLFYSDDCDLDGLMNERQGMIMVR
jgi:hypothetical protein